MTKRGKVLLIFLVLGIAAVVFSAIYYDIKERRRYYIEYRDTLMTLTSSIESLKNDLIKYEKEIAKLELERESIHKEIKIIFKDNEEIDKYLSNGDWDYNIKFLTDYLSRKDSIQE